MKQHWLLLILIFILSWASFAQTPNLSFINFNEKDGLPEKYIYSITQDDDGYIWIGTASGLYQFNGKTFNKFNSNQDKPGHQINNILQNIYKDVDGKIWLSSLNAIQIFDPNTSTFSSLDYSKKEINQLIKSLVSGFFRDSKKNLWITTQTGFWYLYDENSKSVKQFIPEVNFITKASKNITKIIETTDGKLWALSTHGIFEFNANGTIISHFNIEKGQPQKNVFFDGYFDSKHNCFWLATGFNGIAQFDVTTKKFTYNALVDAKSPDAYQANYVTLIAKKSDNEIWFAASNLGVFTISDKKFFGFDQSYNDEYSYKSSPVSRLFKDKENNLWIGSFNGLSQLPWQNNQIKTIPLFNSRAKYTVEPYGVLDYNNSDLLIGNNTSNGLLWWKKESNTLAVIENPFYKNKHRELRGIHNVKRNSKGEIYAVSNENLFFLNQNTNQLIPINVKDQEGKKLINIEKILFDENDNIYLFSYGNGFYYYDVKANLLKHFNMIDIVPKYTNASSNLIEPRLLDKQKNIWFTKTEGVYCYKKATNNYIHFANTASENTKAKIVQSIDIIQNHQGHYWISTIDNGIFELTVKGNESRLMNYTKENSGLPSDYCNSIVVDKKGFLWIGTLNGLVKFDTKTKKTISVLNRQHGLKESSTTVMLNLLPNGDLVANHYGMLTVVNVNSYKINSLKSIVNITAIKVLDAYLDKKTLVSKEIKLKHNQNFITINWSSNVLNNANQNRFAYQLSGVDKDWIYSDKNAISYSNLNHGNYIFKVKSANNDGVWGDITSIEIIIETPFWNALWFYGLILFVIAGILYGFYQFKLNQVKKEEEVKSKYTQQIAEIEMKALRAQMNPHFIFNSLNSIQKYILKNDSFAASQYLTKFSKLIRLILDHSNQNYILLSSETELLKLYIEIEALRFDDQFDYEIKVDEHLSADTIQIPSMIIQPYIENAIWHGLLHKESKGKLVLEISKYDENTINVTVIDNGIGRQKAQELKSKQVLKKKSYGLQITEDRISILNKTQNSKTILKIHDLIDDQGNALGTKVELIIPVQPINL